MKKVISLVLVLVMCLSLTACKSKEAKNVESLIEAIGEVTLDSETAVISAENAYNALTDEDKAEIENYEILITARSTLDSLIDAVLNEKYKHNIERSCDVLLVLRKVGLPAQKVPAPQAPSRRQAAWSLR